MDIDDPSPILVVPGWGGSGPEHWQSYWQRDFGAPRVELDDWLCPHAETWIAALEHGLAALARRNPRPPVLVAHSLGTVVTYEALHAYGGTARWANVRTFVTLGSPLGIPNLIFDALDPAPKAACGAWPSAAHASCWSRSGVEDIVITSLESPGVSPLHKAASFMIPLDGALSHAVPRVVLVQI